MRIKAKVALLALAIGIVGWLYASGAYEAFDPDSARRWLRDAGAWGGLFFVVAYSCLQPLGVRSILFLLSAPMIWDPFTAFFLSWAGTMGASIAAFGFARFVAREWVQRRLPRGIRRLDDRLVTQGLRTVLLLRLIFYTTPTLQYGLGVSRVAFGPFLLGTVLGVAPLTALVTLLGARMSSWLERHPLATWPWDEFAPFIVIAAVALVGAGLLAVRKWQDQLSGRDGEQEAYGPV